MDKDFDNFMVAKGLRPETRDQYHLYYDKVDPIHEAGLLTQEMVYDFINTYKSSLVKSLLRLYFEYKGITDMIIPKKSGSKVARKKPVIMSENDYLLLLELLYAYRHQIALMVELSYCCALRRGEVCNILVKDVDWEEWLINKKSGKLNITYAKGGKERTVIVPSGLMEKLKDYVNESDVTGNNYLFYKNKNKKEMPIDPKRYWDIFHKAIVELFGKKYKLHTLRFSKATNWFEQGIDIVRIQQRLGHSDISTTRLYINPDEEKELERWRDEE